MSRLLDPQSYYDRFSAEYDRFRHGGYHSMIDELQVDLLLPHAEHASVLEVGCGTGLLMGRLKDRCGFLMGLDLSKGMLNHTSRQGHTVVQGTADELPFKDETFDLVYTFKVLAHVPQVKKALGEMARVLRPGGHAVCDFYNPWSLRGIIKKIKPKSRVARGTDDSQVFTRYDRPKQIRSYLPRELELVRFNSVRVLTPWAQLVNLKGVGPIVMALERIAGRMPLTRLMGGFLVATLRKNPNRSKNI